jgi:hypothetical protein
MLTMVIHTPEEDAMRYNNATKSYERRPSAQLLENARQLGEVEMERARKKAIDHNLSLLSGRFELSRFRSDEVEELVSHLEKYVTQSVRIDPNYGMPVFAFYEKQTETAVVDNVRDLTFNVPIL